MATDFFFEETWAGYKELSVEGKKVAFLYGWMEVEQEYLSKVVEKYHDIFMLEDGGDGNNFLKIKPESIDKLTMSVLLDVVDNDTMDWFELVDLESKTLLNSSKKGEESAGAESLGL
jgi:hypothetical protein